MVKNLTLIIYIQAKAANHQNKIVDEDKSLVTDFNFTADDLKVSLSIIYKKIIQAKEQTTQNKVSEDDKSLFTDFNFTAADLKVLLHARSFQKKKCILRG